MRTIKEILKACNDDVELLACIICLVFGYIFIALIFWSNINWQCGVLSVFLSYGLCEAACYLNEWMEAKALIISCRRPRIARMMQRKMKRLRHDNE